jgi:hypothetical protein
VYTCLDALDRYWYNCAEEAGLDADCIKHFIKHDRTSIRFGVQFMSRLLMNESRIKNLTRITHKLLS